MILPLKDLYSLYNMSNIERAKNDNEYLGELIENNVNLIWHAIHKYINISNNVLETCGVTRDDLLQLGKIGFIKAIRAFDTTRGVKFSSFAVVAIVREIRYFLRSNFSIIKVPRTVQALITNIKNLEADLGYLPPPKDLAAFFGTTEKRIKQVLKVGEFIKSIDESSDNMNYANNIESNERVDLAVEDKLFIDTIIETVKEKLTDIEMEILKLQLSGNNQCDTARDLGISNMKVSRTVHKIRSILESENFINKYGKDDFYDQTRNG